MPDASDQRIISADDHMDIHVMPAEVWQERLPVSFRERGPKVVQTDDGPFWEVEGRLLSPSGRKGKGYLRSDDHGFRPGKPDTRLEDMDRDGVYGHVIYSPMTTQLRIRDDELRAACFRAYNDWGLEFSAACPERLLMLAHLPGHDPKAARDELLRVAKLGHRGAIIAQDEAQTPIFEDDWKSFWDAAEETRFPIHAHLGPGTQSIKPRLGSWRMPAMVAVIPMQLDEVLAGMIFSGLLEDRPNVTFVLGEGGLGWLPYLVERLDHEHHKYYDKISDRRLEMLPSEIFARQVMATYEDEKIGVQLIPEIGIHNVMWASDYPHGDSTWPNSRKALADSPLGALGEEAVRRITCDNAAELYGLI